MSDPRAADSRIVRRGDRKQRERRPSWLVDVESAGMVRSVHADPGRRASADQLAADGDEAAAKAAAFLDGEREP